MKQHKWHKEIKAWADGAEIEYIDPLHGWVECKIPSWREEAIFRIKPQPKETKYLYLYADLEWNKSSYKICRKKGNFGQYIGKIKLEDEK